MISWNDLYTVLAAMVPLYVAMFLAYGSVRWWKIFSPDQCSGINRFVAIFAVPLLSFHFISTNDPYAMNLKFIAADTLQKIFMLAGLTVWVGVSPSATLDWLITIFSLSTLPNTLVMGIPLLIAMYGTHAGSLMVQVVVLQCIIWYTLLLFLFEYRAAKILIMEQFPENAAAIVSFRVEPDVVSLDGGAPNFLQADAEVGDDGKLHVTVRKSNVSRRSVSVMMATTTPRPSNLTGAEIYSMSSSRNPTPRGSNFNHADFFSMMGSRPSNFGQGSVQSSRGPTPRPSNFDENQQRTPTRFAQYPAPNPEISTSAGGKNTNRFQQKQQQSQQSNHDAKELHMFVWSSSASPVSDAGGLHVFDGGDFCPTDQLSSTTNHGANKEIRMILPADLPQMKGKQEGEGCGVEDDLRFTGGGGDVVKVGDEEEATEGVVTASRIMARMWSRVANSKVELNPKAATGSGGVGKQMPAASVMTRLILIMVWRKLIRNPNTYSSLVGVIWALVAFKWNVHMPKIVEKSISILSDAGLGMAMFSLGIFMALQPKLIACGNRVAVFAMGVRFLTGPAVMAAASIIIGLRGTLLRIAIVQAALPQGIVPFVFAKEYNVHPAILSTMVIFGMLIALPITLLYYVILGV